MAANPGSLVLNSADNTLHFKASVDAAVLHGHKGDAFPSNIHPQTRDELQNALFVQCFDKIAPKELINIKRSRLTTIELGGFDGANWIAEKYNKIVKRTVPCFTAEIDDEKTLLFSLDELASEMHLQLLRFSLADLPLGPSDGMYEASGYAGLDNNGYTERFKKGLIFGTEALMRRLQNAAKLVQAAVSKLYEQQHHSSNVTASEAADLLIAAEKEVDENDNHAAADEITIRRRKRKGRAIRFTRRKKHSSQSTASPVFGSIYPASFLNSRVHTDSSRASEPLSATVKTKSMYKPSKFLETRFDSTSLIHTEKRKLHFLSISRATTTILLCLLLNEHSHDRPLMVKREVVATFFPEHTDYAPFAEQFFLSFKKRNRVYYRSDASDLFATSTQHPFIPAIELISVDRLLIMMHAHKMQSQAVALADCLGITLVPPSFSAPQQPSAPLFSPRSVALSQTTDLLENAEAAVRKLKAFSLDKRVLTISDLLKVFGPLEQQLSQLRATPDCMPPADTNMQINIQNKNHLHYQSIAAPDRSVAPFNTTTKPMPSSSVYSPFTTNLKEVPDTTSTARHSPIMNVKVETKYGTTSNISLGANDSFSSPPKDLRNQTPDFAFSLDPKALSTRLVICIRIPSTIRSEEPSIFADGKYFLSAIETAMTVSPRSTLGKEKHRPISPKKHLGHTSSPQHPPLSRKSKKLTVFPRQPIPKPVLDNSDSGSETSVSVASDVSPSSARTAIRSMQILASGVGRLQSKHSRLGRRYQATHIPILLSSREREAPSEVNRFTDEALNLQYEPFPSNLLRINLPDFPSDMLCRSLHHLPPLNVTECQSLSSSIVLPEPGSSEVSFSLQTTVHDCERSNLYSKVSCCEDSSLPIEREVASQDPQLFPSSSSPLTPKPSSHSQHMHSTVPDSSSDPSTLIGTATTDAERSAEQFRLLSPSSGRRDADFSRFALNSVDRLLLL